MDHASNDLADFPASRDGDRPLPESPADRWWGMAAHMAALVSLPLASVVGPLAVCIGRRENRFIAEEARAALNFQLTMLLLYAASVPFFVLIVTWWIGALMWWCIGLMNFLFVLVAGLRSLSGNGYRYPFGLEPVEPRHLEWLARKLEG
ncbi:MAG: DUF4870 domain-containing protein [Planctomycetes bacterium]|nr:DUF4870 domain-containing protein [Planctomycetota bacterium]